MEALKIEEFKALIKFAVDFGRNHEVQDKNIQFEEFFNDLINDRKQIIKKHSLDKLRKIIPNFDIKMQTSAIFNQTIQQLIRGEDPIILLDETIIRLEELQKRFEHYIINKK